MNHPQKLTLIDRDIVGKIETSRRHAGMDLSELARMTGIPHRHLLNIESGLTPLRAAEFVLIAQALQVDISSLLSFGHVLTQPEDDTVDPVNSAEVLPLLAS